jgi:hypothetical protein
MDRTPFRENGRVFFAFAADVPRDSAIQRFGLPARIHGALRGRGRGETIRKPPELLENEVVHRREQVAIIQCPRGFSPVLGWEYPLGNFFENFS